MTIVENAYFKYLSDGQLRNHLYNVANQEERNLHDKQGLDVSSVIVDDFFKFYLDNLKISPEELILSIKDNSNFSDIFCSYNFQKIKEQSSWIDKFMPAIEKNTNGIFDSLFSYCLERHSHYLGYEKAEDKIHQYCLEKNTNFFKKLVEIGKNNDYFVGKNQEFFFTPHTKYKELLIEEKIIGNSFEFSQLIEALQSTKKNELSNFLNNYSKEIVNCLCEDENNFHILCSKGLLESFVSSFLSLKNGDSFIYQTKFIENFSSQIEFREIFEKQSSIQKLIVKDFPETLFSIIDNLSIEEKTRVFNNTGYDYYRISRGYNNSLLGLYINHVISFDKEQINLELTDKILKEFKKFNTSIDENGNKNEKTKHSYIGLIALVCLSKKVEMNQYATEETLDFKNKYYSFFKDSLKEYYDNAEIFVKSLKNVLNFLEQNDQKSYEDLNSNIMSWGKSEIEKVYDIYQKEYNYQTRFKNIIYFMKNLNCVEFLDVIEEKNLDFHKEFTVEEKKDKKRVYRYLTLPFILIEEKPEIFLPWFLKKNNISKLAEARISKKNIVEYFLDTPQKNKVFEVLKNDLFAFRLLALENKKTYKKILLSNDADIIKLLSFEKMNDILQNKEDPKKKNKI